MILRDLEVFDRGKAVYTPFGRFVSPITDLYLDLLGSIVRTKGILKVQFRFYPRNRVPNWPPSIGCGVYEDYLPFDFGKWRRLRGIEKRRFVLDAFHQALVAVAIGQGWPVHEFERAKKACIERQIEYRGLVLKRWIKHPKLPLSANLAFAYDETHLNVDVVIRNNEGKLVGSAPAVQKPSGSSQIRRLVRGIKWVKGGRFVRLLLFVRAGTVGSPDINVFKIINRCAASRSKS